MPAFPDGAPGDDQRVLRHPVQLRCTGQVDGLSSVESARTPVVDPGSRRFPGSLVRVAHERFDGEICGFGTTSGVRVVIGRWANSPFGSFADAMVEQAHGGRVLVAPSVDVADFVGAVYTFDDTVVCDVSIERSPEHLHFDGGPLTADVTIGERDALGWALRCVPRFLATSVAWARLVDPLARVTMRGVRTSGRTAAARETYGATDRRRVTAVRATWADQHLGTLADIDPPVRFGFSSTPIRPSIVAVTTTVRQA
jgi:hypothetical protein